MPRLLTSVRDLVGRIVGASELDAHLRDDPSPDATVDWLASHGITLDRSTIYRWRKATPPTATADHTTPPPNTTRAEHTTDHATTAHPTTHHRPATTTPPPTNPQQTTGHLA